MQPEKHTPDEKTEAVDQRDVIVEDLRTSVIGVDDVVLLEANTNLHSERSVDAIAASIKMHGLQSPIKLDNDNVVLKGNGTVLACRKLGVKLVPFSRYAGSEPAAYSAMDNRSQDFSETDTNQLALVLRDLTTVPEELWNAEELAALEKSLTEALNDPTPPPDEFKVVDSNIPIDHVCPRCSYKWSGSSGSTKDASEADAAEDKAVWGADGEGDGDDQSESIPESSDDG